MKRWRIALGLAVFAGLMAGRVSVCAAGPATKPAAASGSAAATGTAESVLRAKGLTRVGNQWLIEGDVKLQELLRTMRAAQHKVEATDRKRAEIEKELRAMQGQADGFAAQEEAAAKRMAETGKEAYATYNVYVNQVNIARAKQRSILLAMAARAKDLDGLDDPTDEYLDALTKVADVMDAASKEYEGLAHDVKVTEAIQALDAAGRLKFKLGPSVAFAHELPNVERLRDTAVGKPIKLEFDGGVPHVPVTINGSVKATAVVDSGAAIMTVSPELAEELELKPAPDDEVLDLVTANGKVVKGHLKKLRTVQVGPFTAEDVVCAILPPSAKGSDNLLGGSFLHHFVYKMDLRSGTLRLSQISGKPSAQQVLARMKPPGGGAAGGQPASRPAASASAHPSHFTVTAGTAWLESDIHVVDGTCYRMTAEGAWVTGSGVHCGPDGTCPTDWRTVLGPQPGMSDAQRGAWYLGQHPRSALVARVGTSGPGFFVGTGQTFLAPTSGRLWFRMNDGDDGSAARSGNVEVTVMQTEPVWVTPDGTTSVFARIDANDFLHVTNNGVFWEWGGEWGKVGEHEGHYPTIINNVLWWPTWADGSHTEMLKAPGLDGRLRIEVQRVIARRGNVEVSDFKQKEVVLHFSDEGLGSSQVGCVLKFIHP